MKIIKKLKHYLFSILYYFFSGLKAADKKMMSADSNNKDGDGGNIEIQNEEESVYKDLLRGEITQEVRELRHEMYYSERESHKYKYIGNGVAVKKDSLFSEEMKNLEHSDGFPIQIVQVNYEDTGGLNVNLDKNSGKNLGRSYTIEIKRKFTPRFKLEEFCNKLVVKRVDEKHAMLDFYVTKYRSQFKHRQKVFTNEMEKIYMGDKLSDVLMFDSVKFITNKAYGAYDLIIFEYNNIEFDNIVEYEGNYVLKFFADIVCDGEDIVKEFYDKKADEKFKTHARRDKQPIMNVGDMIAVHNEKMEKEEPNNEAERLFNSLL